MPAAGYTGGGARTMAYMMASSAAPLGSSDRARSPRTGPGKWGLFGRGGVCAERDGAFLGGSTPQETVSVPRPTVTVVFRVSPRWRRRGRPLRLGAGPRCLRPARRGHPRPARDPLPRRDARPRGLDPGLALLVFVDDLTAPRARVRLADLVRRTASGR